MMDIREKHAWHIQNLIEVEPDAQVVILQEVEALQKELDELKASIPHLISNAIHEALDKFGSTNGYHAIDLVDHMEDFADQLTSKE